MLLGSLIRAIYEDPYLTRKQVARILNISISRCNALIRQAVEEELISVDAEFFSILDAGRKYLETIKVDNAIILASGVDVNFVPFTHEKPKALMKVEGERIIERHIKHLKARGIHDITIVVGYLAEKFEYLTDKYDINLVFNSQYTTKSNISSLYYCRDKLKNTYIIRSDQWIWENIFHLYEPAPFMSCYWREGAFPYLCAETNGKRRILNLKRGGKDKLAVKGPTFISREMSEKVIPMIIDEFENGHEGEYWETVLQKLFPVMKIYANPLPPYMVQVFHTFEDLRDFEISYAEQSGNANLKNIASIFNVTEGAIRDLTWLDVGMTNLSFRFRLYDQEYIYRIPGEGSENFISRKQEGVVYKAIEHLDISDEVVYFDPDTGIKISKYYANSRNINDDDLDCIEEAMHILRKLHTADLKVRHAFDIEDKMRRYENMCQKVDCIRFEDFSETKSRLELPLSIIRESKEPKVLCHIDAVTNNFLLLESGELRLLDWEYGGMCHPVADVAMFGVFGLYDEDRMETLLTWYFGRPPELEERKLCYSYMAVAGILWSLWAEYRQYYGEDFGEYAMMNYRLGKKYTRLLRHMTEKNAAGA